MINIYFHWAEILLWTIACMVLGGAYVVNTLKPTVYNDYD
jgi:hypothetical protein